MTEITLTKPEARKLAVASQFCFEKDRFAPGPDGTCEVINHLGYVQIDTISVVERAHHHTLWNRHHSYNPLHLDTLQTPGRRIFEYWSHAAAYLPLDHYRFCLPRMRRIKTRGGHWFPRDKKMMRYVLDRIKNEGPLESRDFKSPDSKAGPWWGWKPAKIALEHLFMQGSLLVVQRNGFRKIYDLAERVIPPGVDTRMPTPTEMAEYLIGNALRSPGLVTEKDITYLRKDGIEKVRTVLQRKLKKKQVTAIRIQGVKDIYYTAAENLPTLDTQLPCFFLFLFPFDNFIIRRQRTVDIFDFLYQLECYVPAAKRKRGYFSLPVLYRDRLLGTMDAKAHRKTKVFTVKNLHLDDMPKDRDDFWACFHQELRNFMAFNGCTELEMTGQITPQRGEPYNGLR